MDNIRDIVKKQDDIRKERQKFLNEYVVISETKTGKPLVNYVNLAKLIIAKSGYHFKTIEDHATGKQMIYYYKNGMYYPGGQNRIKKLVDDYIDELSTINRKNEVIDYIRNQTYITMHNLEPPLNLINLHNGIYDINSDKLILHNPKYFFLQQIPIDYDPKADCPNIKKFFKQVVYSDYIPVIQEMFGFCLYRDYFLHKAFLLYGGGRNGKGTTIRLLERFLGEGNYSTRDLHTLSDYQFAKGNLHGKLANLGAEIAGKALFDTSVFKTLTGGEPLMGDIKYGGTWNFVNYAKLIFNSNHIPYTRFDKSFAFFQRWMIIVFPETFEIGGNRTNPHILKKLTTPQELSGLFNWAIAGLHRLLENYDFSVHISEEEAGEWYEILAHPERQFIDNYLEEVDGVNLSKAEVYNRYDTWAREHGYFPETINKFTRSLKKFFEYYAKQEHRKTMAGETINIKREGRVIKGYKNINWKLEKTNGSTPQVDRLDFFKSESFISKADKLKHVEEKMSR